MQLEQYTTSEADRRKHALHSRLHKRRHSWQVGAGFGLRHRQAGFGRGFSWAQKRLWVLTLTQSAIKTARENADKAGLADKVQWVNGDIAAIAGHFDTVLQNPPFGVQTREADRAFLVKALEVSRLSLFTA